MVHFIVAGTNLNTYIIQVNYSYATRPLSRCYLRSYLVKKLHELTKSPTENTRTQ